MSRLGNELATIATELGSEVTFSTGDALVAVKEIRKALDTEGTYSQANKAANIMEEVIAIRELVENGAGQGGDVEMDKVTIYNDAAGYTMYVITVDIVEGNLVTIQTEIPYGETGVEVNMPKTATYSYLFSVASDDIRGAYHIDVANSGTGTTGIEYVGTLTGFGSAFKKENLGEGEESYVLHLDVVSNVV